ncbi:hypothetical protein ACR0SW_20030, partial [Blautia wexlerae]|uniref:hypothetical protein n=1 Tax=Blautia wexlerae TaxID=418240 RepID=UPI003D95EF60
LFVFQSSVFRISEKLHNGKQGFALTNMMSGSKDILPLTLYILQFHYIDVNVDFSAFCDLHSLS